MQKNTIYKTDYAEVAFAYARGEEKRYTLNIILKENGDTYDCLSHTYNHYPTEEDKEKLYALKSQLVKEYNEYKAQGLQKIHTADASPRRNTRCF